MFPRFRRLVFFGFETSLLAIPILEIAGHLLGREISLPLIRLVLLGLFAVSLFGLPVWCAVYCDREQTLANVGAITIIGLILSWVATVFFFG